MAELNRRQREFLIGILEKTVVYAITIAVIGRLLDKQIGWLKGVVLGCGIMVAITFALWLAKHEV